MASGGDIGPQNDSGETSGKIEPPSQRPFYAEDQVSTLFALSSELFARSVRTHNEDDLEQAISVARRATSICTTANPHAAMLLHILAESLLFRFDLQNQAADLDEALSYHNQAILLRPPGHSDRYYSELSLARALHARFCLGGQSQDLTDSVRHGTSALELFNPTYHDRPTFLYTAAVTWINHFNGSGVFTFPARDAHSTSTSSGVLAPGASNGRERNSGSIYPFPSADEAPPLPPSKAEKDWKRQKDHEGASDAAIDAIMGMTGLENVKAQVLRIKAKIDTARRQRVSVSDEQFNIVLRGNPGTGKTTVARQYANFLASVEILQSSEITETTGSRLASEGIHSIKDQIEEMVSEEGGVIFIDEAYQLTNGNSPAGRQILDFLLAEMENHIGKIVFIFAGYDKPMETFFEHNPGLSSRVPYTLQFADYSDEELLHLLGQLVIKKYDRRLKVEGGLYGLYMRIAVRRLGRGRGREGFGNARALRSMFALILERQAVRLTEQRRSGGAFPDDLLLTKEDIIGPDPSGAVLNSNAWKKLHGLIGLREVKQSIQNLFDLIAENYKRELVEKQPIQMSLNRVFLGNPGTGKTTVAKLYGQILADIGALSNGEVVLKNPVDFVGSALGASERNTKAILAATVGKVLVIDEAYSLYGGGDAAGGKSSDVYRTAVIDGIVAEVQSVPGEDRCVIMCGYEAQMREMFQNVNPGLSGRFAIEDAFRFEDFAQEELREILDLKLKEQDLNATEEAKNVALDMLNLARNRPNFGNGREVENILNKAKNNYRSRQSKLPKLERSFDAVFLPVDFDPNYERMGHSSVNLENLFEDMVGMTKLVEKFGLYQRMAGRTSRRDDRKSRNGRDRVPTRFIFKGGPGTGKTTVARKLGQVYYDMGFLSTTEIVECSVNDLVGQYVGHTGPKTKQVFERALGKVLLIDEAYRLTGSAYGKEALHQLVNYFTQETYARKLICIMIGPEKEMDTLLEENPTLASRIEDTIRFDSISPEHFLEILRRDLAKDDVECPALAGTRPTSDDYKQLTSLATKLSALDSWGNGHDIKTLAQQMVRIAFANTSPTDVEEPELSLRGSDVISCFVAMLAEREARSANLPHPTSRASKMLSARSVGLDLGAYQVREAVKEATVKRIEHSQQCLKRAASEGEEGEEERARKVQDAKEYEDALKEQRVQKKLRQMELCPQGFEWTKENGGYRCKGGSHWVSNADLGV